MPLYTLSRADQQPLRILTLFFILFFCCPPHTLFAQEYQWVKGMTNNRPEGGQIVAKSIKVDPVGNTYVAGYFMYTADFDPGPGVANLTSEGSFDIFIAKYDAAGNYVFAKRIGSYPHDLVNYMTIDAAGNMYITGYYSGKVDFDPGPGQTILTSTTPSTNDAFFAKYSNTGNLIFAKSIGTTGADVGNYIEVDASGNIYITGSFGASGGDFDPGPGVQPLTNKGGTDLFFAKYDSNGAYLFAKGIGGTSSDAGATIKIDNAGNVYLCGTFSGQVHFDPDNNLGTLIGGSSDAFFAKYTNTGEYIFVKALRGGYGKEIKAMGLDASGNIYLAGTFFDRVDFDPGTDVVNISSQGSSDIFFGKYSPAGDYIYARTMGGSGSDNGYDMFVDGTGNIYLTGSFSSTVDFDPGPGVSNLVSSGSHEIFIAKYNTSGEYMSAQKSGGISADYGYGITVDAASNIHICGTFTGTADFNPAGSAILSTDANNLNGFILKLNADGSFARVLQTGNHSTLSMYDAGNSITTDAEGNIYVTGYFFGTLDFDPGPGEAYLSSNTENSADIFIAKYDASGNLIFVKAIGGPGYDQGNAIALDANGHIYITGYFNQTVDFDPGSGQANRTTQGSNDIFLAKYDPLGNFIYVKTIGGSSSNEIGYDIAIDATGNVYVTGMFMGTAYFDGDTESPSISGSVNRLSTFVAKYNTQGDLLFAKAIGGTTTDVASSRIKLDAQNNIYIAGFMSGTIDFDPGPGTANLTSAGSGDIFFAKYDTNGNYLFAKSIGADKDDRCQGLAVTDNGSIIITGYFGGTVDFDPGPGVVNLVSGGTNNNTFIARYNSSGNYVYAKSISSTSQVMGKDIKIDKGESCYIIGIFAGIADFDPGPGTADLISENNQYDIFFAKYDSKGNYVYAERIGSGSSDEGNAITLDPTGNILLTGAYRTTANFDPTGIASDAVVNSINATDLYIAKYSNSITLPVTFIHFEAKTISNTSVRTSWSTASQFQNAYFEVQKSSDGIHFIPAGRVNGCGTCNTIMHYSFDDPTPYAGKSWYRLVQVDDDGKSANSNIVSVQLATITAKFLKAFPNPFHSKINIECTAQWNETITILLYDYKGAVVFKQTRSLNKGINTFDITPPSLPAGLYILEVQQEDGSIERIKLIH